jgi:hypothetical protein
MSDADGKRDKDPGSDENCCMHVQAMERRGIGDRPLRDPAKAHTVRQPPPISSKATVAVTKTAITRGGMPFRHRCSGQTSAMMNRTTAVWT